MTDTLNGNGRALAYRIAIAAENLMQYVDVSRTDNAGQARHSMKILRQLIAETREHPINTSVCPYIVTSDEGSSHAYPLDTHENKV